jgi:hypothetical protein
LHNEEGTGEGADNEGAPDLPRLSKDHEATLPSAGCLW